MEIPSNINIQLAATPPITPFVKDGCVTASARGVVPHLGIDFENGFLPQLQRYSMNNNPEDNHMLGIATAGAAYDLSTSVHTAEPLTVDMKASTLPPKAEGVHPRVVREIIDLAAKNKISLSVGRYDMQSFSVALLDSLSNGQYAFVFLNWRKWNPKMQEMYGNPNHIPVVCGINDSSVLVMDPTVEKGTPNLINVSIQHLFNALNEEQQIVFIGKK